MTINRFVNIIFYDIPVKSERYQQEYTRFRKYLLQNGYYQLQESVYACKLPSKERALHHKDIILALAPKKSQIRMLLCTKKQFKSMYVLSGELSLYERILLDDAIRVQI